jgi:hypothetical protein
MLNPSQLVLTGLHVFHGKNVKLEGEVGSVDEGTVEERPAK